MSTTLAEMTAQIIALKPDARAAAISAVSSGLDAQLGLAFTWCAEDRVVATLAVDSRHTQIYGLVHGGVYCTMVEAVGSCGAAMRHLPGGRLPVGTENRTRFLRATRTGAVLTAVGTPAKTTNSGSIWAVRITDQDGRICAEGTLATRALPPGASVGGEALTLPEVHS